MAVTGADRPLDMVIVVSTGPLLVRLFAIGCTDARSLLYYSSTPSNRESCIGPRLDNNK
jgi:hypothetical protein